VKRGRLTGLVCLVLCLAFVPGQGTPIRSSSLADQLGQPGEYAVLITAIYYDTCLTNEPDEAFRLMNVSASPVDLTGWTATDEEGTVTLAGTLDAGQSIWIARQADGFEAEFGFSPGYEYGADTDPTVPDLALTGDLTLANEGDQLILKDGAGAVVDSVVYEDASAAGAGWTGGSIGPYQQGSFGAEGQVLYRKLEQATGLPVPDTHTAADWAQATDDDINGKKVQYPGWDLERYFTTASFTETATVTYTIAPDNIYEAVLAEIDRASGSIYYEGYTFENAHLADAISARMRAHPGMTVTFLLEGEPAGGITDQQKYLCRQIEYAGGQVYFMHTDDAADVHDRYDYQHGKWMIVDEERLLTGSVNLDNSSMPADDKRDGTEGKRGVWLITDAPGAVEHALDVFRHDVDPEHHRDLFRWTYSHPTYGAPPAGFTPSYASGGSFYPVGFRYPRDIHGTVAFEIVQSPENSLRTGDSLLGLVARAGRGDYVAVEQFYEGKYWGPADSNPTADPNPRLEAYIAAARRGAIVSILLDELYDVSSDPRSNRATCEYVDGIARAEGLRLYCRLGNPTGKGIENNMVLVLDDEQGYVHIGSIDGSENSSKNNREMAVQVRSTEAFFHLFDMFSRDLASLTPRLYMPVAIQERTPAPTPTSTPPPSHEVLITYIEYDPPGSDVEGEYVQIENWDGAPVHMTGWTLRDAADHTFTFPTFTLTTGATVKVWTRSGANTGTDLYWGSDVAIWNNRGDTAYLRNAQGNLVDVYYYYPREAESNGQR
jgi:cardiolipin synthase